jgi:hypothetical protein|nr:MAG TPA: hypothetical protein [Caudoviricetes sp.]
MLDNKRILAMRARLGVRASKLIRDDRFLPMFRNRQIRYKKEFEESVKVANKKRNPEHFFAKIWSCENVEKTLKMMRSIIYCAIEKAHELQESIKRVKTEQDIQANINPIGLAQFAKMKHDLFGL